MIDRRYLGMTGTATLAMVLAQPVLAQATLTDPKTVATDVQAGSKAPAATDSGAGLTDIIVTATRRDSRLQTTPIAVTAIDQSLIKQSNPRSIGDLAQFVPNFSAATITGFNAASFSIRGVGQNTIIVYFEPPFRKLRNTDGACLDPGNAALAGNCPVTNTASPVVLSTTEP